jgi:hypothetical protein
VVVYFHPKVEYKWFRPERDHETGSPGYIAAESDGAVDPVNAVLILKNTIPERLRAGRVVAGLDIHVIICTCRVSLSVCYFC